MAIRLKIREIAETRGLNISSFQREAKIPMSTARRLWYSTGDGKENGPALKLVNLDIIERIAEFFEVDLGDLLESEKQDDNKKGRRH